MNEDLPFHARFGGLDWSADLPLDQFDQAPSGAPNAIKVCRRETFPEIGEARRVGQATIGSNAVRFDWGNEASFELRDGNRIGWMPHGHWRGRLPVAFFSSMAAITLGWRGIVPLHASAVVLHGKAWLIAGEGGAGKSTLVAELLTAGGELLADDLTALMPGEGPAVSRGRPAMRLHPDTAGLIEVIGVPEPTEDGRGKLLVRPRSRAADQNWPIGGILLLGRAAASEIEPAKAAVALGSILFRPKIMSALPGRARLREGLLSLARTTPVAVVPSVSGFGSDARAERIASTLRTIERLGSAR